MNEKLKTSELNIAGKFARRMVQQRLVLYMSIMEIKIILVNKFTGNINQSELPREVGE